MDPRYSWFFKQLNSGLISIILIGLILLYGNSIILPLLCAMLLSTLLLPSIRILHEKGAGWLVAILVPLTASIIIGGGMLFFLSSQIANFLDDVPLLNERMSGLVTSCQQWVHENTRITVPKQNQYISQTLEVLKDEGPKLLEVTFASLKEIVTYLLLVPIYTFLILRYRGTLKVFLIGIFKNGSAEKVKEVLSESTAVAQQYLIGLMIETSIIFILNLIGFSILGIKYNVFLAFLAALLNLIPYVGLLAAGVICMATTLVSSDNPGDVVWVGIVLVIVHLYDNNFGVPIIVGNKVRINGLVTLVGVLVGGALCGVPGMFLAIPGLAVLKIIFDKVPDLQPWGILLGDNSQVKKPRALVVRHKSKIANQKGL